MEINRTHSHNSVLGINSIIMEEDTSETCLPEEVPKHLADNAKFEPEVPFKTRAKYENAMSNVKCVAIIEDVEKMFDMNDSQIVTRSLENTTSIPSSNATSFSSVFNSIAPFSDMKKRYEGADSTLSVDAEQKSMFHSMNDLNQEASPMNKFLDQEHPSMDGDFYKEAKKEMTLSSALLLDESQIKFMDEVNKKKVPPPYEKLNLQRANLFGAMPSCYVISKDDYFKNRKISSTHTSDSRLSRLKKAPTSSQINNDQLSAYVTSQNVQSAAASARPTVPNANQSGSSNFVLNEAGCRGSGRGPKNTITAGTQLIRGNSMVSVVNKGSSSMLILKIQTYTKNYLDINPDFGWRRLIDDKNLPFSNFSNNSYMFYIESKKSTHIISLANLAINIACRAFILAITHGYLDLNLIPDYLIKYLPSHVSNALPLRGTRPVKTQQTHKTLNFPHSLQPSIGSKSTANSHLPKHYYYKGGVDCLDEECGKETMYLKSNFLGIFAISSLVRNLTSDKYRNRYQTNRKPPNHAPKQPNLDLEPQGSDSRFLNGQMPNTQYATVNTGLGFYKYVPIPEYGWVLCAKAPNDLRDDSKSEGLSRFFSRIFKKKPKFESLYPNTLLCKVKPPHHSETNCKIMVDAGSLAMNVAEQLYRLEISTNNREKFPKNTFGFSANSEGKVTCPDGSVVEFVPEEVILNTASLLHEIYITQTYLIL